jgi:DNA adenine methylase
MALFRYPGGKVRYTDFILPALYKRSGFSIYVEPFVGGGSVALAMAERYPNVKLILNDLDADVSAFWDLIANASEPEFQELADRIMSTVPTVPLFNEIKDGQPADRLGKAFRAFFLNRASYGGRGNNPLGGKHQKSDGKIDSRWSAKNRVLDLHAEERGRGTETGSRSRQDRSHDQTDSLARIPRR